MNEIARPHLVLRGIYLLAFVFIVLVGDSLVGASGFPEKPNIIFIITDDQHRDSFGFLEKQVLTPNIDRLAREGIYFSRSYVASSVCTPSRYTCLTGQYASRCPSSRFLNSMFPEGQTRVTWNVSITDDQVILPQLLQRAGYKTGIVGKWHVGGISDKYQLVPPGSDASDPDIATMLRENQENFCRALREKYGFDFAGAVYSGNIDDDRSLNNAGIGYHNMEWMTRAGLEFIEDNQEDPFFLYFSTTLLHYPEVYKSLKADPRMCGSGLLNEPIADVQPSRESVLRRVEAAGLPERAAEATWLDDGIGSILAKLEELDLAENTLIIYFNDNGMDFGGKGTCYEGGIHTPTMAFWPGIIKPNTEEKLIQNIDFVPTILDVCGIEAPSDMKIDGESLVPLFKGEDPSWRSSIYSEVGLVRCVVTDDGWKYIAFRVPPSLQRTKAERMADQLKYHEKLQRQEPWRMQFVEIDPEARYFHLGTSPGGVAFEQGPWRAGAQQGDYHDTAPWTENYFDKDQLYQISVDPMESTNLADDPEHQDKLREMQEVLKRYLYQLPGNFAELKP